MARTVSTATRQDLLEAVRGRYQGSLKSGLRILDELVAIDRGTCPTNSGAIVS